MFYNSYDNMGVSRVLSLLKSHRAEYLSGQDLSDVLKISRVAIWNHIRTIKKLGYTIESKHPLGYKLVENTSRLLPWEITSELDTKRIGRRVYFFDEIDTTQNYALGLAMQESEDGSLVIAERQTHGKGRLDRPWYSPEGGIWASLVIQSGIDVDKLSIVPLAVAVALCESIQKTVGVQATLKWPNDVMINSKKVAGVIIDSSLESSQVQYLVIGIGINFDIDVKEADLFLKNTLNYYGATSILSHGNTSKIELVQTLLEKLEKYFEILQDGKSHLIIKKWSKYSETLGKNVSVVIDDKECVGVAKNIDADGALVIQAGDDMVRVLADDVMHLR